MLVTLWTGDENRVTRDVDFLGYGEASEEQQYGGIRLRTVAHLGKTRIPITVDVGFGDAMIAPNFAIEYPSLLDMPAAHIRAYPPPTVVAEKFHAIVALGLVDSRMKDYYDLWAILNTLSIAEWDIDDAILRTFERRETDVPVANWKI